MLNLIQERRTLQWWFPGTEYNLGMIDFQKENTQIKLDGKHTHRSNTRVNDRSVHHVCNIDYNPMMFLKPSHLFKTTFPLYLMVPDLGISGDSNFIILLSLFFFEMIICFLLLPGLPDLGTSNLPAPHYFWITCLLYYGYGLGNRKRSKPVRYLFNEAARVV